MKKKKPVNFVHNKPHTEEAKAKMRAAFRSHSTKFKKGHAGVANRGSFKKGTKPWNWKGGVRSASQIIKDDVRWKKWRKEVFERDRYTCQGCGAKCGNGKKIILHPHHVLSKVKFPELAFDIKNGLTLCVGCHKKTDNYGGRASRKI